MNRNCWTLIAALTGALLTGCAESQPRPDPRDAGVKDPMNYNPAGERRDISGGGIMDYDRKEMNKDVNSVLNP